MAQVIIRNLDQQVVKALKMRATLHGHSLEQELRDILAGASRMTLRERLALVDRIRAMSKKPYNQDSTRLIREDRDER